MGRISKIEIESLGVKESHVIMDSSAQGYIDKQKTLPFLFLNKTTEHLRDEIAAGHIDAGKWEGNVIYDRELNVFTDFYGNELGEDSGYNEVGSDGELSACQGRRFSCCGKTYRAVGAMLIDENLERSDVPRLSDAPVNIFSHPGMAYRCANGAIVIRPKALKSSEVCRKKLFREIRNSFVKTDSGLKPLTDCDFRVGGDIQSFPEFEASDLHAVGSALQNKSLAVQIDLPAEMKNKMLRCRIDSMGRKIYYKYEGATDAGYIPPAPTVEEAEAVIGMVRGNSDRLYVSLNVCRGYQCAVLKNVRRAEDGSRYKKWRGVRKWNRNNGERGFVKSKHYKCVVRLRKVAGRRKSDWSYFLAGRIYSRRGKVDELGIHRI